MHFAPSLRADDCLCVVGLTLKKSVVPYRILRYFMHSYEATTWPREALQMTLGCSYIASGRADRIVKYDVECSSLQYRFNVLSYVM